MTLPRAVGELQPGNRPWLFHEIFWLLRKSVHFLEPVWDRQCSAVRNRTGIQWPLFHMKCSQQTNSFLAVYVLSFCPTRISAMLWINKKEVFSKHNEQLCTLAAWVFLWMLFFFPEICHWVGYAPSNLRRGHLSPSQTFLLTRSPEGESSLSF